MGFSPTYIRFFPLNWLGAANLKYFKLGYAPHSLENVHFFKKSLKFVASLWQLHHFYLRTKSNARGLEVLLTINCICSTWNVVMLFARYLHDRAGTSAS